MCSAKIPDSSFDCERLFHRFVAEEFEKVGFLNLFRPFEKLSMGMLKQ